VSSELGWGDPLALTNDDAGQDRRRRRGKPHLLPRQRQSRPSCHRIERAQPTHKVGRSHAQNAQRRNVNAVSSSLIAHDALDSTCHASTLHSLGRRPRFRKKTHLQLQLT